ncbi:MAG: right-handed parallel beta-helix repeat-containing protein, partial [Elusimicrobiales bacterium]|nr:right-handed parallel beta-helix repeat-containing protein [Elusimicrobiales bacterium]
EITGGSGARLAGLEVSGCSVGLSQTGGRAGIKDSRMADIKGSCVSCSGGELTVSDVKFERAEAGLSIHAGGAAGVDRAEILAMVSGAELTGKSRLRLDGSLMRGCAAGVRAEDGSLFEAAGFTLEQVKSHGVQARGGSRLRLSGAKITACGGSGVETAGDSAAELANVEMSGCSAGLSQTGGRAGIKDSRMADIKGSCVSCLGGELAVSGVKLERAGAGLSIHGGAAAGVDQAEIRAMISGVELTGRSSLRLTGGSVSGCARGAWLQEGSAAAASGCLFSDNSGAGIYADSAECAAVSPVFLRNTIGVFADRGAAVTLDKADFSSNQTGIKADNKASVKLTSSVVSGCAWDGVWCGAGASLLLAANRFRNNRYAIKEDGPCSVKSEGNKFENSTAADHLAWPRVEGANRP